MVKNINRSIARRKYYQEHPEAIEQAKKQLDTNRIANNERMKVDDDYRNRQLSGLLEDAKKRTKIHKEELYDLYWNQQLDTKQIAKKLSMHYGSIQKAMKRYGIPTRSKKEIQLLSCKRPEIKNTLSERTQKMWQNPEYRILKTEQVTGENNPFYDKHHTEETCKQLGDNWKEKYLNGYISPMLGKPFRERNIDLDKWAKSMHKGLATSPNKVESIVLSIVNNNFIGFAYNGDGKYLTIDGLSPDFVDIPNKLIIEVFGEHFHIQEKYKKIFKKDMPIKNSEEYRIHKFKEYGYDTLIIWDYEINTLKEEQIVNKIKEFINKTKV